MQELAGISARLRCSACSACAREPPDESFIAMLSLHRSKARGSPSVANPFAGARVHRALATPPAHPPSAGGLDVLSAPLWAHPCALRGGFASRLALMPASSRVNPGPGPGARRLPQRPKAQPRGPKGWRQGSRLPRAEIRTSRRAAGRKPRRVSRRPGAEAWTGARQQRSWKRRSHRSRGRSSRPRGPGGAPRCLAGNRWC